MSAGVKRVIFGGVGLVALAVLGLVGWLVLQARQAPIGSAPPREVATTAPLEPDSSSLSLRAEIPLEDIAAMVESRVPPVVLEKLGEPATGDWRYDLTIERTGKPVVRGGDRGHLVVEVPLAVFAKAYRGRKADRRAKKGADAPKGVQLRAGIALDLDIDYRIGPDWRVDPVVELSHRWLEEPRLQLGPVAFKVRKPVDKQLLPKLAEAEAQIREQMMAQDEMRTRMEKTWAELHEPRPLDDGPGWLVMQPTSLAMTAPSVAGDHLVVPVSIEARIRTVLGGKPTASAQTPLPERRDAVGDGGVHLTAEVALPWARLQQDIEDALSEQVWERELGTLQVDRVQLYPSGDRIALGLDVRAESMGSETPATVWFLGRPILSGARQEVVVEDFDFEVEAGGGWVETANHGTLREAIRARIEPSLRFPYGEQVEAHRARMNAKPPKRGLALTMHSLDVAHLGLTRDALVLHVRLEGEGRLSVDLARRP